MAYDFSKMFAGFELPAADRFQTIFVGAGERGQDMVRKSQEAASEMTEIAKANLEAITEAGRIAATGVRSLGQDALASGRDGFEQASTSLKTLADAKSPTEFFQLQNWRAARSTVWSPKVRSSPKRWSSSPVKRFSRCRPARRSTPSVSTSLLPNLPSSLGSLCGRPF